MQSQKIYTNELFTKQNIPREQTYGYQVEGGKLK